MHDEEVGVVDVELYRLEEVLNCLLLCAVAVDEILVRAIKHDLARDADGGVLLEADRRLLRVSVVEYDSDARLLNTCLSALVDKVLYHAPSVSPAQMCRK